MANDKNKAVATLTEVHIKLGELSSQFMQLSHANSTLSKENAELKEKLNFSENLVFKRPLYVTSTGDGPFCTKCWDDEHKAIRLDGPHGGGYKRGDCHQCQSHVEENPDYKYPTGGGISFSPF